MERVRLHAVWLRQRPTTGSNASLQLESDDAVDINTSCQLCSITPHVGSEDVIINQRVWVKLTRTRNPNKRTSQMSRRGMHPLLMGLDKPKSQINEKKPVELSGYESAQRKRFLRAQAEEAEQNMAS